MKAFFVRPRRIVVLFVGAVLFGMAKGWQSPRCTCGHARTKHKPDYMPRLLLDTYYGDCRVSGCSCMSFRGQSGVMFV